MKPKSHSTFPESTRTKLCCINESLASKTKRSLFPAFEFQKIEREEKRLNNDDQIENM